MNPISQIVVTYVTNALWMTCENAGAILGHSTPRERCGAAE
jgi:hypothetical protein